MGSVLAAVVLFLSQTSPSDLPLAEAADGGMPADDAGAVLEPPPPPPPAADAGVTLPPLVQAQGEAQAPSEGFIKGELSVYLGSGQLVVKNNRIGVAAGVEFLDNALFLLIEPLVDIRLFDNQLAIGIGVPIHLELFNLEADGDGPILGRHAGWFRNKDYRGFHDYGKILKYVTLGRKEDNLYLNLGQRYATTLGHG